MTIYIYILWQVVVCVLVYAGLSRAIWVQQFNKIKTRGQINEEIGQKKRD